MPRGNQSSYALLGLLALGPSSGYDLRQLIQASIGHFWSESFGQIYPNLKRLEREGLATRTVERQKGKPDRQVYALTKNGKEKLQEWLERPISPEVPRNELLLKLFFSVHAPNESSRRHVEEYRALQRRLLDAYNATEQQIKREYKGHPELPFWLMTLSYGRHRRHALIAWCEETLQTLDRLRAQGRRQRKKGNRT